MLTNAMPAVTRALQGSLPQAALKQLTQALGNCNQQLTHRGDISVRPDAWSYANNNNGTYDGYPPSNSEYNQYVNNGDYSQYVDVNNPYYNNPNYNTNIDYGDTIIVQGGPPGAPGQAGQAGRDGAEGGAGAAGQGGAAGDAGPPGSPGGAGGNGRDGRDGGAGRDGAPGGAGAAGQDGVVNIDQILTTLLGRLRVRTAEVIVDIEELNDTDHEVVTDVGFNEAICDVDPTFDTIDGAVLAVLPKRQTISFYGP
jgi:hypothetical protein